MGETNSTSIPPLHILALVLLICGALASPESPHVPHCQSGVPGTETEPCPWFEGWYIRIYDPARSWSFAVAVVTVNGTELSVVAILACVQAGAALTSAGNPLDLLRGIPPRASERSAGGGGSPGPNLVTSAKHCPRTGSVQVALLANVTVGKDKQPVTSDPKDSAPPFFDWVAPSPPGSSPCAPDIGFLRARGFNRTEFRFDFGDILGANLTKQIPWKTGDPGAGPEGWFSEASKLLPPEFVPPGRWYIHSLGSSASYRFADGQGGEVVGEGWAHEEKYWGTSLPAGHVKFQGINADNSVQVVGAALHFSLGMGLTSPDFLTVGVRSPDYSFDLRNFDLPGTFVTSLSIDPCTGKISTCAFLLSGPINRALQVCISASAAPSSFSRLLWVPASDGTWTRSCKESFGGTIEIRLWELASLADILLGPLPGSPAATFNLPGAALAFCGDRVCPS